MAESKDYNLPVCDTQTQRRNFPGYKEFKSLDPSFWDEKYSTETDTKTHPDKDD